MSPTSYHFSDSLCCSGGGNRTPDLKVMSLASYHCSTPQYVGDEDSILHQRTQTPSALLTLNPLCYPKMAVRFYFTGLPFTWQLFYMTSVMKLFFYMVLRHDGFEPKLNLQIRLVAKPIVAVEL